VGLGRQIEPHLLPTLPEADHYLIGADGFGNRDADYAHLLPTGRPAAAYGHLYGVLPVGMAFDLAVAALCLESGQTFSGAGLPALAGARRGAAALRPSARLCCLKLGAEQGFGWATLTGTGGA
jgi:hypothetical protein